MYVASGSSIISPNRLWFVIPFIVAKSDAKGNIISGKRLLSNNIKLRVQFFCIKIIHDLLVWLLRYYASFCDCLATITFVFIPLPATSLAIFMKHKNALFVAAIAIILGCFSGVVLYVVLGPTNLAKSDFTLVSNGQAYDINNSIVSLAITCSGTISENAGNWTLDVTSGSIEIAGYPVLNISSGQATFAPKNSINLIDMSIIVSYAGKSTTWHLSGQTNSKLTNETTFELKANLANLPLQGNYVINSIDTYGQLVITKQVAS